MRLDPSGQFELISAVANPPHDLEMSIISWNKFTMHHISVDLSKYHLITDVKLQGYPLSIDHLFHLFDDLGYIYLSIFEPFLAFLQNSGSCWACHFRP